MARTASALTGLHVYSSVVDVVLSKEEPILQAQCPLGDLDAYYKHLGFSIQIIMAMVVVNFVWLLSTNT